MKVNSVNQLTDLTALILRQNVPGTPSESDLDIAIEQMAKFQEAIGVFLTDEERDAIKKTLQTRLVVNMDVGVKIVDKDTYRPWLAYRKAEIDEYYWNRYKKFLLEEKGGLTMLSKHLIKMGMKFLTSWETR